MDPRQRQTGWPAVHGGLFLALVLSVVAFCPALGWPWYLLLPVAGYVCVVLLVPPLRRTFPRLAAGRVDGPGLAGAITLIVLTSAALVAYQVLVHPDVTDLAAKLPAAFGNLVLAGICFSVVNAVLEELIFRGVLYEAVVAEWGGAVAVAVTGALFGIGHVHGYPPGPLGAVLAGGYGVALGLLRWWSGGLGLSMACHVCADATIFGILASVGAFGSQPG
jgi:membrane protease YdiL (CAAX protease family)